MSDQQPTPKPSPIGKAVDTITGDPDMRGVWLIGMGALAYLVFVARVFRPRG